MIISASRRTDIPAFYSKWLLNRIRDGYVCVRNPINPRQVSKVSLSPELVDCIVFWTKNPKPMLKILNQLKEYNYYFQFTLTSYARDIEKNLPSKNESILDTFKSLSDTIGPERVIWRYDPILINKTYSLDYHIKNFEKLSKKLGNYTKQCTVSFIDLYKKITNRLSLHSIAELDTETKLKLAENFALIASAYGFKIKTCSENIDLEKYGIKHASCIDRELIEKIIKAKINVKKDKTQRSECGCVESIDIGAYNTCLHACEYCYANFKDCIIQNKIRNYDENSPMLCDKMSDKDTIIERKMKSIREAQSYLF